MQSKQTSQSEEQMNYTFLVFLSVVLGIVFGITCFYLLQWISFNQILSNARLFLYISISISVLIMLSSYFISIYFGRMFKSRKTEKDLKNFKDYAEAVSSASEESEMFTKLYAFLKNIFQFTKISIYYEDNLRQENQQWSKLSNEKLPLCSMNCKTCPVVNSKKDLQVKNVTTDILCAYQLGEYTSGSYICMPMIVEGKTTAVVQLYNRRKEYFNKEIIDNLHSYIEIISPVIEKKREISKLNHKAFSDALTKVFNRAYLERHLPQELAEAVENRTPLSLLILDIDHFKNVNDNYGHAAGDEILKLVSEIIMRCLRKTDMVARYGGEEFVVLLPKTNLETALLIAERIRESIELEEMPLLQGVKLPNITCSIGISNFPIHSKNETLLLKTADMALYSAKENGRNMVVIYSKDMEMNKK